MKNGNYIMAPGLTTAEKKVVVTVVAKATEMVVVTEECLETLWAETMVRSMVSE